MLEESAARASKAKSILLLTAYTTGKAFSLRCENRTSSILGFKLDTQYSLTQNLKTLFNQLTWNTVLNRTLCWQISAVKDFRHFMTKFSFDLLAFFG